MSGRTRAVAWLLWSFFAVWMIFFVVLQLHVGEGSPFRPSPANATPPVFIPLAVLAFVEAAISLVLNRFLYSRRLVDWICRKQQTADADADEMKAKSLSILGPVFVIVNVLSWSVNESICIYGLTLGIMTRSTATFLPFLAVAAILHLVTIPRPGALASKVHHCFDVELKL